MADPRTRYGSERQGGIRNRALATLGDFSPEVNRLARAIEGEMARLFGSRVLLGLNADMLDGCHKQDFAKAVHEHACNCTLIALSDVDATDTTEDYVLTRKGDGSFWFKAGGGAFDLITVAEIQAGVATTERVVSAARLKYLIDYHGFDGAYSSLSGLPTLFSEDYNDLSNLPTLGTAAALDAGSASGVATLDGGGKIPSSQLPALALVDVHSVADIAARDALTVQEGDVALVADSGSGVPESYIYDGSSWLVWKRPADSVLSVNGNTGVVSLTKTDVGLSNVLNVAQAAQSLALTAGDGLSGGGDLSANRSFALDLAATPGLEISSGKIRTKVDGSTIERTAGGLAVKSDVFAPHQLPLTTLTEPIDETLVWGNWYQIEYVPEDPPVDDVAVTLTVPAAAEANRGMEIIVDVIDPIGAFSISLEMDSLQNHHFSDGTSANSVEMATADKVIELRSRGRLGSLACCIHDPSGGG